MEHATSATRLSRKRIGGPNGATAMCAMLRNRLARALGLNILATTRTFESSVCVCELFATAVRPAAKMVLGGNDSTKITKTRSPRG